MSIYYLLDFLLFALIGALSYYAYEKRIYLKIFEYFKIFLWITISAKLASQMGLFLQKIGFLNSDSYAVTILIGFILNLIILFYSHELVLAFLNTFFNNQKIKELFAKFITVLEITIIVTFSLYILMQIKVIKSAIQPSMNKSISYPYIKRFYKKFLNDDFVYMVLHSDTGTNYKEVIFKSFKNSF